MDTDPVPESSPATKGPKCGPVVRRKRREEVQLALLDGKMTQTIKREIAAKYGISPRMVNFDIEHIQRQWAKDDRESIDQARQIVLRRLRTHSNKLVDRGELAEAALVDYRIARLLGMGNHFEVRIDSNVHVQQEPPALVLAEHLRGVVETLLRAGVQVHGLGAGAQERVVEAEVVPAKNGAAHG